MSGLGLLIKHVKHYITKKICPVMFQRLKATLVAFSYFLVSLGWMVDAKNWASSLHSNQSGLSAFLSLSVIVKGTSAPIGKAKISSVKASPLLRGTMPFLVSGKKFSFLILGIPPQLQEVQFGCELGSVILCS